MPLTKKDREKGGHAVVRKYGSAYMSHLGKKGRKKQLKAKKNQHEKNN